MDDTKWIRVDDAIEEIARRDTTDGTVKVFSGRDVIDILGTTPFSPPERKRGKWKTAYLDHEAFGVRPKILYCSSCNQCSAFPTNFCPDCGSYNRCEDLEIIRCKDCMWYKTIHTWNCTEHQVCAKDPSQPTRNNDDFCSYAERRKNG